MPFDNQSDRDSDRPDQAENIASQVIELGTLMDTLLQSLPEFIPEALVEAGDGDPGQPVVLMELADFVSSRLAILATGRSMVERALWVVESLLDSLAGDEIGRELVGLAFFDSFSPESRRLLAPWLGPRSIEVLEALDVAPQ